MNCLRCGFRNNATVAYCQKCGGKMNLTADEIREALVEKAQFERASDTEHYAKQALFFAIILFVAAVTMAFLAGGAETESYAIPSIVDKTQYTEIQYDITSRLPLRKELIPWDAKRR